MGQKNYRIRRLAVAAIGAVTAVSGIAVLGAGTAQAAGPNTTVVSATPTTIRAGVLTQAAANEAITIQPTFTWASGDTITLTVTDSSSANTVPFSTPPTVTPAIVGGNTVPSVTSAVSGGNKLTITFSNSGTAINAQPILVSGIFYSPSGTAASGPVIVTPGGTGAAGSSISPASSATSNATIVGAPTIGLTAATTPGVGAGLSNQPAGNLSFGLTGLNTGWFAGDQLTIRVAPNSGPNCSGPIASPIGIGFSSAPAVSATTSAGQTAPTFSAVGLTQSAGACTSTAFFDQAVVTLTNSGTITGSGSPPVTITFSGISYNVTAAVPLGNVSVTGLYNGTAVVGPSTTGATTGPSNADVGTLSVTANNPPVGVAASSSNQPISNVVITEAQHGAVPTGNVCVILSAGTFNTTTAPTVTASGGGAAVGAPTVTSGTQLLFPVTTASSTAAATYTVSNLNVNAPAGAGKVTAIVTDGGIGSACGSNIATGLTLYNVVVVNRIFGQTADGTAAAELTQAFPNGCPPSKNVVLATDQNFPDALSASYLAAKLGTGVLLTPTNALAAETVTALRLGGINHVYIVGGPLAVAQNVVTALGQEPVYTCGGVTQVTNPSTGGPVFETVTQVFGQTQYDTAQTVAQFFGSTVGPGSFNGAYPTSTTGTSAYNTTSGLSGTVAPVTTGTPTAILATGQTFPDAMAASGMSYAQQWPILLTQQGSLSSQASAAINNLGIKQVIVMGGPIAVSDTVVTQLEALGVSVLRIAGTDYTDTAQLLAQFELSSNVLNWAAGHSYDVLVARGDFFADALAGSALSGLSQSPIVLTLNPSTLGTGIPALFTFEHGLTPSNQVDSVTVLGGPIAVTPGTVNQVLASIPG